jgi:hypothetical protein
MAGKHRIWGQILCCLHCHTCSVLEIEIRDFFFVLTFEGPLTVQSHVYHSFCASQKETETPMEGALDLHVDAEALKDTEGVNTTALTMLG